jgi:hypothetical protein
MPFDPSQVEEKSGFDPSQINIIPNNPKTTGAGATGGAILAGLPEILGPKSKAKALEVAANPGKIKKIIQAGVAETKIGTGAAIGDLIESAGISFSKGNPDLGIEELKSAGNEFMLSMGLGLPFRAVGGSINKLFYKPSVTQSPEVNLVYDIFGKGMAEKGFPPLTLAAATNSHTVDVMDNVARSSIGGSGRMTNFDAAFKDVSNNLLDVLSDTIAPRQNADDLTQTLFDVIAHQEEIGDIPAVVYRQTLAKQATDFGVIGNPEKIVEFITKNKDEIDALGGFGGTVAGTSATKALLNMTAAPTASNLLKLRSVSKAMIRSLSSDPTMAKTPAIGMLEQLAKLSDTELKRVLQGADNLRGTKLKQMLIKSDEGFGKHHDKFFNPLVTKLKKGINVQGGSSTSDVADLLLRPSNKNSRQFALAAKEVTPPGKWKDVQRAVIDAMRDKVSTGPFPRSLNGEEMLKVFSKADEFGAREQRVGLETFEVIFGKEQTKALREFAEALEFAQRKNPSNVGNVATSLAQGGAVIGAGSQVLKGMVLKPLAILGMITGVPALFARLMTSKRFVENITKGLKKGPLNPAWPALSARIYTEIAATQALMKTEAVEQSPPRVSSGDNIEAFLGRPAFTQ